MQLSTPWWGVSKEYVRITKVKLNNTQPCSYTWTHISCLMYDIHWLLLRKLSLKQHEDEWIRSKSSGEEWARLVLMRIPQRNWLDWTWRGWGCRVHSDSDLDHKRMCGMSQWDNKNIHPSGSFYAYYL